MTTSNEQAAKLPLVKRIVIALRGGVSGGVSAVMVVLLVALVIALAIAGFVGGLAVATKRNQINAQKLITQARQAQLANVKLSASKTALEKEVAALKDEVEQKQHTITDQKAELDRAKLEHDTMEKLLGEIKDSIQSSSAKPEKGDKPAKPANAAQLKFGNHQCDLQKGSTVTSKQDVNCLNLRDAIDAMNSKSKGDKAAPAVPKSPG
jgi:Skp family chaperone for outer membrane proteins